MTLQLCKALWSKYDTSVMLPKLETKTTPHTRKLIYCNCIYKTGSYSKTRIVSVVDAWITLRVHAGLAISAAFHIFLKEV